jgi:hypothetical protein
MVADALQAAFLQNNAEAKKDVLGLMRAWCAEPEKEHIALMRAAATTTDVPRGIGSISENFQVTAEYDMNWMRSFQEVPVAETAGHFKIATTQSTGGFGIIQEGDKVRIEKFTGSFEYVPMITVAHALEWTMQLIQDRELAVLFSLAKEFKDKYWKDKADRHYSLLFAAKYGTATSYDSSGSTVREKDINTIVDAFVTAGARIKDRFGQVPAQALLYMPYTLFGRIGDAYKATDLSAAEVRVPVVPVFTWNTNILPSGTGLYGLLVFPGMKVQMGSKMEPTLFEKDNRAESFSIMNSVWARYGAGVGDAPTYSQIQKVNFQ